MVTHKSMAKKKRKRWAKKSPPLALVTLLLELEAPQTQQPLHNTYLDFSLMETFGFNSRTKVALLGSALPSMAAWRG